MTATTPLPLPVEQWRTLQYVRLGFDDVQIATAFVDDIDYHDAALLIAKGCDIDLALEILRR